MDISTVRETNAYGWLEVEASEEQDSIEESQARRLEKSDLSEDQSQAFDTIVKWIKKPSETVLTLGGYAGTGKTTLVSLIARHALKGRVAFCAYTGKAANVLHQKLRALGFVPDFCGTIHRLIYEPVVDEKTGAVSGWQKVEEEDLDYKLIVVDEASMIDAQMLEDLKSYGIPILAVGDHGQLPPVQGQFNLMSNPEVRLEHIHRQAADNPIIRLSASIRQEGITAIPYASVSNLLSIGDSFAGLFRDSSTAFRTAVLCFTNKKRNALNAAFRRKIFGDDLGTLRKDDLVVCLKNVKFKSASVFNGMRGQVQKVFGDDAMSLGFDDDVVKSAKQIKTQVSFPDDRMLLQAKLNAAQFGMEKTISKFEDAGLPPYSTWREVGMLFDYGYCLTTHKAQGSEFADAAVVLENMSYMEADFQRRWAYTAVTRASQRLYLVR